MATRSTDLTGCVAAITGGTRGIGKATAAAFVREGIRVAIGGRDMETAQRVAKELGHGTIALPLETSDRASVKAFLDETERQLGPLDIVVHNAGIMIVGPPAWDEDDRTTARQIDVNIYGVINGVKEAVPRLLSRKRGHIVNIASGAGKIGFARGVTYSGSKHFIVGMTESLRSELRGTGVEVTCVTPGIVNTELASGHRPTRGVRVVEAEDVAKGIVAALRRPRAEVSVRAELSLTSRARALLPYNVFEALLRATNAKNVMRGVDPDARAAYETRAQHQAPASNEPPTKTP